METDRYTDYKIKGSKSPSREDADDHCIYAVANGFWHVRSRVAVRSPATRYVTIHHVCDAPCAYQPSRGSHLCRMIGHWINIFTYDPVVSNLKRVMESDGDRGNSGE